jgi:hypothetical protein
MSLPLLLSPVLRVTVLASVATCNIIHYSSFADLDLTSKLYIPEIIGALAEDY